MYKLIFYVPESHHQHVKTAVFTAGAGKQGDYDQCCWQVLGMGQFRPLKNSQPFLGKHGEVETVPEYRVEMICEDDVIQTAVLALKQSHPYEEPAYDVVHLCDF